MTENEATVIGSIPISNEGFIDDEANYYPTFRSTEEVARDNKLQFYTMKTQDLRESIPEQIIQGQRDYRKELEQSKLSKEWEHVSTQPEEVQRAIVDNIGFSIVFKSLIERHRKYDRTAYELSGMKKPSNEEQHVNMYSELMKDLMATAEEIGKYQSILERLKS